MFGKSPLQKQISETRKRIKQLERDLRQISTKTSSTYGDYGQSEGKSDRGYKWIEDTRMIGPQQQKRRIEQELAQLRQELALLERERREQQR